MKTQITSTRVSAILLAALAATFTGCETDGDAGTAGYSGPSYDYYETGYYHGVDGNRPRPEHPIAMPPSRPIATPMPMSMPRGGGRR
jgi:hypothetical protein